MVRPAVREVVAVELDAILRKFDPHQPRDPEGKWSLVGAIKHLAANFVGHYKDRQAGLTNHHGEPVVTELSGGISAKVNLLTYPDGSKVVRKEYRPDISGTIASDAEELAAPVLDAFGVPAPAVHRVNDHTILMEFVPGEQGGVSGELKAPRAVVTSADGRRLGLADAVLGHRDRNGGSWIKSADGHIVAIDNGNAFEYGPQAAHGNPFVAYLMSAHGWANNTDVDRAELAAIRLRIEALRPEFERRGRARWYEEMLHRIDAIQKNAAAAVRAIVAAELQRLAGHDVTPGHDELHHYWTKGEGLAKWVKSPHPWTALYHHLVKYVNPEMAKRMASAWFHEVLGFWPGEKHVGAVRLPKAGRSELVRAVVAAELQRMLGEQDDDPVGELDDDTLALLQALSELDGGDDVERAAKFDPAKHPRGPDGKFLNLVDRIVAAIKDHKAGKGKGDPFHGFDREQLRKAAKARGIPLKRGEDRDSIAKKLLADLGKPSAAAKPKAPAAKAAKDKLDELDDRDLRDLALEYGIDVHGKSREYLIAAIRRQQKAEKAKKAVAVKKAAPKPAVPTPPAAAASGAPDLDKMRIFDLVKLANQHGIDHVGKNRAEIIKELRQRMRPHGPSKYHRELKGIEDLRNAVENGAIVDEKHLAGGAIGDTRLRTYADGTEIVWKRTGSVGENDAEQLASKVARALGLHAPRVYRNRDHEVNMNFVDGDVAADHPAIAGVNFVAVPDSFTATKEGRMMGLLDQLIANTDRHNGNWMIGPDGHYVPIDHGYAFGNRPGHKLRDGGKAGHVVSAFAGHYSTEAFGNQWQSNDLTKGDIAIIRGRLERLKSDFAHIGREQWHKFMMDRLDAIGQHAQGTTSQLLPSLVQ